MEKMSKEYKEAFNAELDKQNTPTKTLLTIKTRLKLSVSEDETGIELNDGYDYNVNGSIAELADALAKFAKELPKNGFGEKSDTYFVTLIGEYFNKLSE